MNPRDEALVRIVRDEGRRVLATLIRLTGDVQRAEDALQDAVVRALETWPRDGVPRNPGAWLTVTARRCAIDQARRETGRSQREMEATAMLEASAHDEMPASAVRDDQLRLVFTCCHPSLAIEAQVALTLRSLCGLSVPEIARALMVSEQTMAKRLTRTRRKIADAHIPYRVPDDADLPERVTAVAATVYLLFNEGYAATSGTEVVRRPLVDEAIRMGRILIQLMPDEPALLGLTALMILHDSRRMTRVDDLGEPVLLADQDRSRWDRAAIQEGVELLGRALRLTPRRPDAYAVQAAIASCHSMAATYAATPWDAVVSWYDVLVAVNDTPVTRLNRAVAIGERDGWRRGLAELETVEGLENYPYWHAARAEMLDRLGLETDALPAYRQALELAPDGAHAERIRRRLDEIAGR